MSGREGSRRRVAVLGSTGTIGRLTLDVAERLPERIEIDALAAGENVPLLAEQVLKWRPARAVIADADRIEELRSRVGAAWGGEILAGGEGLLEAATAGGEIVVNALVGAAGLPPSLAALRAGRTLALANKESLVVAGELMRRAVAAGRGRILPIDSEHSGLLQCLGGADAREARRVILTASGGPFRTWPRERLATARPEEALRHPTWRMGKRITVDSATLLNKGFEIHEARWLFDLPAEKIDVWIHPQSVVHALVEWPDGSLLAQLSAADMRLPIQLALCYPDRPASGLPRCELTQLGALQFEPVDPDRYPCLEVARGALAAGGTAPAVLNAADEVLVEAFLAGRIPFTGIAEGLSRILDAHGPEPVDGIETVLRADRWARERTRGLVGMS